MRSIALFVAFMFLANVAFPQSQTTQMTQTTRDQLNSGSFDIPKIGTLYGISGPGGKILGDPYLDTTWQIGIVKFYGKILTADSIAGVPIRLDLLNHEVDIKAGANNIRAAKAPSVRSIRVNNAIGTTSTFINVREYRGEADALLGFFEQVSMGKLALLQYPSIYIKRANFNMALNSGTKDDELLKQVDWYVSNGTKASKFSPGKKAILTLMADKKDEIETFLKNEKPDLKSKSGLMTLFSYYNSL
jgi:hypothetical protein